MRCERREGKIGLPHRFSRSLCHLMGAPKTVKDWKGLWPDWPLNSATDWILTSNACLIYSTQSHSHRRCGCFQWWHCNGNVIQPATTQTFLLYRLTTRCDIFNARRKADCFRLWCRLRWNLLKITKDEMREMGRGVCHVPSRDCKIGDERWIQTATKLIYRTTVGHKKRATFIFTITLANMDRFQ